MHLNLIAGSFLLLLALLFAFAAGLTAKGNKKVALVCVILAVLSAIITWLLIASVLYTPLG